MDDIDDFHTFYELADRIIADASKEDVAEAARLLALNVAHYQLRYGALPIRGLCRDAAVTDDRPGNRQAPVSRYAEPRRRPGPGAGPCG